MARVRVVLSIPIDFNEMIGRFFPRLRNIESVLEIEGGLMVVRPFTDDMLKAVQTYEPSLRDLLAPRRSEVIIDVGANIGRHSLWLSKMVGPEGIVLAVEPEPSNFRILEKNIRLNNIRNVIATRTALGISSGYDRMFLPSAAAMGRVTRHKSSGFSFRTSLETLDNLVAKWSLRSISAIKVDAEGDELSVLEGGVETVRAGRPRLVIEVHGEAELSRVSDWLSLRGMKVRRLVRASAMRSEQRHFLLAS